MDDEQLPPVCAALREQGASINAMVAAGLALYVTAPGESEDPALKQRLRTRLIAECADVNVAALLMAALSLDTAAAMERLGIEGDPAMVVADELIGMAIAEYIGGKRALFNFVRYDREKPGILAELGVFLDDAVGGLVAGCMTELCRERP